MSGDRARAFLTAEWRYLAMLTFETEAALLRPFVPRGTELDTHDGRALLSLVGFRFLRTRVLGCRVPFHQDFEEVNLRFYVRREVQGELRRGVTFIREIVPRHLITFVARSAYNEPYLTLRMHSDVPASPVAAPGRIRYAWRSSAGWQSLALTALGAPRPPDQGTEHAFISEHHWGYTRQRDGSYAGVSRRARSVARVGRCRCGGAWGHDGVARHRVCPLAQRRAYFGIPGRGIVSHGDSAGAAEVGVGPCVRAGCRLTGA